MKAGSDDFQLFTFGLKTGSLVLILNCMPNEMLLEVVWITLDLCFNSQCKIHSFMYNITHFIIIVRKVYTNLNPRLNKIKIAFPNILIKNVHNLSK